MIPDRDIYADKHGKVTTDPAEYAFQIAVKGHQLDERTARRHGITDMLVSTGEPNAVRRVTGRNAASVRIVKAEETEAEPQEQPQEPAVADEPTAAEETKPEAEKPTAKEGEKKK